MSLRRRGVGTLLERALGRLRFPWLFLLTMVAFVVNVIVPDPIPLMDEILLGLVGLLLGSLREERREVGQGGEGEEAGNAPGRREAGEGPGGRPGGGRR